MAEIEIKGLAELTRKLQSLEKVNNVLEPPMHRAVDRIQKRMAMYPPVRPGSRYSRGEGWRNKDGRVTRFTSENLGKKWTTKVTRSLAGIIGKVGNDVSYGPFVQSKQFQARVHQGRWTNTDEAVLAEYLPTITDDFNKAVQDAINKA
jgi:hypothetical protein